MTRQSSLNGNPKLKKITFTFLIHVVAKRLFDISPSLFNIASKIYKKIFLILRVLDRLMTDYSKVGPSEKRTIYLVKSRNSRAIFKGGITRVENFFHYQLINKEQSTFRVIPVMWDGKIFVVIDNNFPTISSKRFAKKQVSVWNPSMDDILFFQTSELLQNLDEDKLQKLKDKCKIVVSIYDILPITHPEWFTGYLNEAFLQFFTSAWNFADLLIVNCDKTKVDIETYGASKGSIFRDNIPKIKKVNLWSVATPKLKIRKKSGNDSSKAKKLFKNNDPVLLLLSTVEPRKGHEELINAAKIAWGQGARFNLLFIGQLGWISKSFKAEFQEFLQVESDRAIWFDSVEDHELEEFMGATDLLISPSLDEGYGLPVAEALQRGIPVLANGIPTYQELFGTHAVLYGPGESFPSLQNALMDIESVMSIGSTLLHSAKHPYLDSVTELLESIGEI